MEISMTDIKIINKFLTNEYHDEHPIIYLYTCGQKRSQDSAVNKCMGLLKDIFSPPYKIDFLKSMVEEFLEIKKEQYKRGEIKVKPLY